MIRSSSYLDCRIVMLKSIPKTRVVTHICNFSTQGAEGGGLREQG